jgi:hypothetical protein
MGKNILKGTCFGYGETEKKEEGIDDKVILRIFKINFQLHGVQRNMETMAPARLPLSLRGVTMVG